MTYDLRIIQRLKHLCAIGALVLGALYPLQVNAQAEKLINGQWVTHITSTGMLWNSQAGNTGTIHMGGGVPAATPVPTTPQNLSGWHPAGNYGVAPAATGATVSAGGTRPLPGGRSLPVTVSAPVSPAQASKAIGRFLAKGSGVVGVLALGVAAYDLAKELGFILDNSGGSMVVLKSDPNVCTVSPCYEYTTRTWDSVSPNATYLSNESQACERARVEIESKSYAHHRPAVIVSMDPSCYVRNSGSPATYYTWPYITRSTTPSSSVYQPSTMQELEDAIAAKSGWPQSSNLAKTVADAMKSGEAVQTGTPTVTGPASVQGPTSTTNTPAQNGQPASTTTTNTTHNVTYEGNKYTINDTKVTTINNGNTITTTTETKEPEPQEDPCKERPDSNACREDEFDTPDDEIPKTNKTITYAAENLGFAGGACPADKFITPHGMSTPIKLVNWVDNCEKITTYARPMILAMAAFAAMMIIFAGRTE